MALHRLVVLVLALFILSPFAAEAQTPPPPAAASGEQLLKSEELDALVAGIALYPDTLLSLVLMASTYPLEVVQADRWAKENKTLKGDQLKAAVDKQAWDESVKSLVATPDVLSMMSTKLDWTQKLGDAVLAQQPDVMDAIQRLRTKAEANNKLTSSKEQKVTKKQEQGKQVIVIEPTEPNTVYVPYYDPAVVYGGWPYPAYPPYYFPPPGYIAGGIIAGWNCIWRRLRSRALGVRRKLLGRGSQLGRKQHQRQPPNQYQQQRQQFPAPTGTPWRRQVQQRQRAAEIWQQQYSWWRSKPDGFPRPRRRAGAQARRRRTSQSGRRR